MWSSRTSRIRQNVEAISMKQLTELTPLRIFILSILKNYHRFQPISFQTCGWCWLWRGERSGIVDYPSAWWRWAYDCSNAHQKHGHLSQTIIVRNPEKLLELVTTLCSYLRWSECLKHPHNRWNNISTKCCCIYRTLNKANHGQTA